MEGTLQPEKSTKPDECRELVKAEIDRLSWAQYQEAIICIAEGYGVNGLSRRFGLSKIAATRLYARLRNRAVTLRENANERNRALASQRLGFAIEGLAKEAREAEKPRDRIEALSRLAEICWGVRQHEEEMAQQKAEHTDESDARKTLFAKLATMDQHNLIYVARQAIFTGGSSPPAVIPTPGDSEGVLLGDGEPDLPAKAERADVDRPVRP